MNEWMNECVSTVQKKIIFPPNQMKVFGSEQERGGFSVDFEHLMSFCFTLT